MKLPLRYFGHPDLRKKAKEIDEITPEIRKLAKDMIETMEFHHGVGLAAPQVGKLLKLFVRRNDFLQEDGSSELGPAEVIINPHLSSPSKKNSIDSEGCLSIPGIEARIKRPEKIHLRYQNLEGTWIEEDVEGFLARVTMHENDHLNGVLLIDRMDPKERERIEPILQELKKQERKK